MQAPQTPDDNAAHLHEAPHTPDVEITEVINDDNADNEADVNEADKEEDANTERTKKRKKHGIMG